MTYFYEILCVPFLFYTAFSMHLFCWKVIAFYIRRREIVVHIFFLEFKFFCTLSPPLTSWLLITTRITLKRNNFFFLFIDTFWILLKKEESYFWVPKVYIFSFLYLLFFLFFVLDIHTCVGACAIIFRLRKCIHTNCFSGFTFFFVYGFTSCDRERCF